MPARREVLSEPFQNPVNLQGLIDPQMRQIYADFMEAEKDGTTGLPRAVCVFVRI